MLDHFTEMEKFLWVAKLIDTITKTSSNVSTARSCRSLLYKSWPCGIWYLPVPAGAHTITRPTQTWYPRLRTTKQSTISFFLSCSLLHLPTRISFLVVAPLYRHQCPVTVVPGLDALTLCLITHHVMCNEQCTYILLEIRTHLNHPCLSIGW